MEEVSRRFHRGNCCKNRLEDHPLSAQKGICTNYPLLVSNGDPYTGDVFLPT